jgi:hypothetical protein
MLCTPTIFLQRKGSLEVSVSISLTPSPFSNFNPATAHGPKAKLTVGPIGEKAARFPVVVTEADGPLA